MNIFNKKIYVLKHKNVDVITFQYNGRVLNFRVINNEHIPLSLKKELNENAISRWIEKRLIPVNRDGYEELIEKLEILETEQKRQIVLDNNALSLSDCYWITYDRNKKWEDVNYYTNDFDDEMAIIFLESGRTIKNKLKLIHTPTLMLDGQMPKAWIVNKNNERILLKRSRKSKKNVVSEIIVSKLLDILNVDHIHYEYMEYKGKLCCACKCFCDSNTELITAEDFTIEDDSTDISSCLNFYINKCKENGIVDADERINEMLTLDYLVGNTDRHWKNFGVMRDTNSLKIKDMALIYDNDRAFDYMSDNSYMISGMMVDNLKYIIKENRITSINNFDEIIKPILNIDVKGMYNIKELYDEMCRRYKILNFEINNK